MDSNQATAGTVGILDEFQTELVKAWQQLPGKAFFFSVLALWLLLFQFLGNSTLGYIHTHSLFAWMMEAYSVSGDVDDTVGKFVPFLVAGLFFWKRKDLLAGSLTSWWPALFLVVGALFLHVVGYVVQVPHLSVVALFVGIYGLTGLAWGLHWLKNSFFPFCLFVFCVPFGTYSGIITNPLRLFVSWLVEVVCHSVLGINVIRMGNQLMDPSGSFVYEVAAACSGIRSLIVIFLIAMVYGFVTYRSFAKRLFFISLAVPFAVLGNLMRMLCIVLAASLFGKKWGDYVHESTIFSLIPYIPAILGLLLAGNWIEKWEKRKELSKVRGSPGGNPSGPSQAVRQQRTSAL